MIVKQATYNFLWLFLICSTLVKAQLSPIKADEKHHIIVDGNASILSTALPIEMSHKFIWGGFIDDEMKANAVAKHQSSNYLGVDAGFKIQYLSVSKKALGVKNGFWGISLESKGLSYNRYSKDLFQLVFYGNEPFEGQTLKFDGDQFDTQWYQALGFTFGSVIENVANGKLQYAVTPKFLSGTSFQSTRINQAELLTNTDGVSIDVMAKAKYAKSDTLDSNPLKPYGYGAGLSLNLQYLSKKHHLSFSIEDFGIISWNNKINYNIDTAFSFNGIVIEDIFNIQDTIFSIASAQDSLLNSTTQKVSAFLPAVFQFYYRYEFNDKMFLKNWLNYRLVNNYLPFVMSQFNYKINDFTAGISAAYGGYGEFQAGLAFEYDLDLVKLSIGSSSVLGFLDIKNQSSENIFGRINFKF